MKKNTKQIINIITNILDSITTLLAGIAIYFFVFSAKNTIELFLYASIGYLLSLSLKLLNNEKENKKLIYCGVILLIFTLFIGGFIIVNSIKWSLNQ